MSADMVDYEVLIRSAEDDDQLSGERRAEVLYRLRRLRVHESCGTLNCSDATRLRDELRMRFDYRVGRHGRYCGK